MSHRATEYKSGLFLKVVMSILKKTYTRYADCRIKPARWNAILNLTSLMPEGRETFWNNLSVNENAPDIDENGC